MMNESTITEKPWGHEILWAHTDKYVGKILVIKGGHALSRQFHVEKDETIMVLDGELLFEKDGVEEVLEPGQSVHIPPDTVHRMTAINDCRLVEVSTTELDDVVRLDDRYGRS
jgi:quercetin dioxygenase-like cupin family protein